MFLLLTIVQLMILGSRKECQVKTTKVYLDGTAKCEINDSTVARKGETGSEVLFKSINVNACNIYMMKGDKKQILN